MHKALLSSSGQEWRTPQEFFDMLNKEFNFTLDVAAANDNALCPAFFTKDRDALKRSWRPKTGSVFCNPPYGREIGHWVKKAYHEAIKHDTTIVMLLPARTDTSYFHNYIYGHAEIRFLRGRLKFTDSTGKTHWPAPFPSMVVIYNKKESVK